MLKKILYAGSGSDNSQEMLKFLMNIPIFKNSEITFLHVVPLKVTEESLAIKWKEGEEILSKVIKSVNLDPDKTPTILRQGEPKATITKVAQEIDADLIIMGSSGLKGLEAFLSNSVSQYVFQLTDRPMLLVKDDIYVKRIKNVMVALDKSEASNQALFLALSMLRDYPEGELFLARINPDLDLGTELSQTDMENNPILIPAIKQAKRMGVKYRCVVKGGQPKQQICQLVKDYNINLLLLGSPDRRPSFAKNLVDLDRLLSRSLSDYIRVNADCPVLFVRR